MKSGTASGKIIGGGRGFRKSASNSSFSLKQNKKPNTVKTGKEEEREALNTMIKRTQELAKAGITDSKEIAIKLIKEGLMPAKLIVKVDGKNRLRTAAIEIINELIGSKTKQKDISKDDR